MKLFRILGSGMVLAAVVVGGTYLLARFADGPLGIVPGGPLVAGEIQTAPVTDWSFAAEVLEIEHQLLVDEMSRTTWILVHEGLAYIPCSLSFPPFKNWHKRALSDGRAVVRIDGVRFPVQMQRVEDPAMIRALGRTASGKYPSAPPSGAGVWFFQLSHRPV